MTFEQKKARAIALMDSKKMWRSNYAPPLLRILWRLGIRLPPLPFMPFWQVTVLTGGLWGISWGCAMWFMGFEGQWNENVRLWYNLLIIIQYTKVPFQGPFRML